MTASYVSILLKAETETEDEVEGVITVLTSSPIFFVDHCSACSIVSCFAGFRGGGRDRGGDRGDRGGDRGGRRDGYREYGNFLVIFV